MLLFFLLLSASSFFAQPTYNPGILTFDILSPASLVLSGASVPYLPAELGPNIINPTGLDALTAEVVYTPNVDLCNNRMLTPNQFAGKIVIAQQGFCNVYGKALTAYQYGALLLIIHGCNNYVCPATPVRATTNTVSSTFAPTISIHYNDGIRIKNALNTTQVFLKISGTGAIESTELDSLTTFARDLQLGTPKYGSALSGGLRGWANLTSNDSNVVGDPCLNRVMGIWCVGGRVVDLYSSDMNVQSAVPASIGNLTSLVSFYFPISPAVSTVARRFFGSIPCEVGKLLNLIEFRLPGGNISELLDVDECWPPNLRYVDLSSNSIPSIPLVFETWTTLKYLDISNNRVTNYPLLSSVGLEGLNLEDNKMSGDFESFSEFSNITSIRLGRNYLTGTDIRSYFESLPYLTYLDISSNNFSGGAPFFNNTKAIITLDIGFNNFSGALPTWSLASLTTLSYSHNRITDFGPGIKASVNLLNFDGGYNLYTNLPYSAPYPLFAIAPRVIRNINLEYNRIVGYWPAGLFDGYTNIQSLKLAGNNYSSVPSTLFTELSGLQVVDFANNNMGGPIPGLANRVLVSMKFDGNPNMHAAALPSYITRDQERYVKQDKDETFLCPILVGKSLDVTLEVDPTYYDYQGCVCQDGTYGVPPDCQLIPDVTNVKSQEGFSDAEFGDQRLQTGVNTVWNVTQANPLFPIKAITFTVKLNRDYFNAFEDIIAIYEGGPDLKGNRVFVVRGTDDTFPERPSDLTVDNVTVKVVVFDSLATLNFQSRDPKGIHFNATVDFAYSCPLGFTENLSTRCRQQLHWSAADKVVVSIYLLMSLGIILIVAVMAIVLLNLKMLIIRASSPLFCLLTLFGLLVLTVAPITYIQAPTSAAVCHLRVWLTALPLVILMSNLLVKVDRIRNIFQAQVFASLQKKHQKFTNERLLGTSTLMMIAEFIMLIVFSALELSKPTIAEGPGSDSDTLVEVAVCSTDSLGYQIWLGIQLSYIGLFILWGAFLAFKTKDAPTAFNESTHILGALLELLFLAIILIPLNFMLNKDPSGLMLIRGLGQTFATFTLTSIIFGPKLYYLFTGRGNDKTMLTNSSVHGGQTSIQLQTPNKTKDGSASPKSPDALPSQVRAESSVRDRLDSDITPRGMERLENEGYTSPDPTLDTSGRPNENTRFIGVPIAEGHEEMEVV